MRPITLGIRREIAKNRPNDRPRNFYEYGSFQSREVNLSIWGCNSRHDGDEQYTLQVSAYCLATGWSTSLPEKTITLGPNRSTELFSGPCPEPPQDKAYDQLAPSGTVVIQARLVETKAKGKVVARFSDWPQPYKLLDLPDPGLRLQRDGDGNRVTVTVTKPAKGVWLSVKGDDDKGVEFSDNSLDLFPGDTQTVIAKGIQGKELTAAWLGSEKAQEL